MRLRRHSASRIWEGALVRARERACACACDVMVYQGRSWVGGRGGVWGGVPAQAQGDSGAAGPGHKALDCVRVEPRDLLPVHLPDTADGRH
jgi:hypothetical protein